MVHGIDVSIIAPARYLPDFARPPAPGVHHVTAQRVLEDRNYRDFYLEQVEQGSAIVLDNGVFDLGVALDAADLVRAAGLVKASEIILPDVMGDTDGTIEASDRGAAQILALTDSYRLCAVVHGQTDADWLRCYEHFLEQDYTGTIALPASRKPGRTGVAGDRVTATAHLAEHGLVDRNRGYRLLGLGRTGHLELFSQREHDWIASVDCATPVILGYMGVPMELHGPFEKIPTPRVETIVEIPAERFELIRRNIDVVRTAAGTQAAARQS